MTSGGNVAESEFQCIIHMDDASKYSGADGYAEGSVNISRTTSA